MMASAKLLELERLSYSYDGTRPVLQIETFTLYEGERVAILGANGAGKSTLFLCLNGVLRASGTIRYRGKAIGKGDLDTLRRNVGIVFQNAEQQIVASTVAADVSFGPMNLGLPRDTVTRRVDDALRTMSLTALADRPPHYLSGGEKKRVSIAGVLAMSPEVVLFDEPTANLDPANLALLETTLAMLAKSGKTLVVSTHDVDFAWRWANRVVVLSSGQIIADGAPLDVLDNAEVLQESNLTRPTLLAVFQMLRRRGLLAETATPPRTLGELEELLREGCGTLPSGDPN